MPPRKKVKQDDRGADWVRQYALQRCKPSTKPERNTIIQKEEITNLIISLNSTECVVDFLEDIN